MPHLYNIKIKLKVMYLSWLFIHAFSLINHYFSCLYIKVMIKIKHILKAYIILVVDEKHSINRFFTKKKKSYVWLELVICVFVSYLYIFFVISCLRCYINFDTFIYLSIQFNIFVYLYSVNIIFYIVLYF